MKTDAIAAARELLPLIARLRDDTEANRRIAAPIVEALRAARLGRFAVVRELQGLELPLLEALEVYELLAGAEASVAWIVWNNALPCFFGRFLEPAARAEIFGNPAWLYAGSTRPSGRAAVEGDGYRVTGRWSLVSGCELSEWLALRCVIEENGQPRLLQPGVPEVRMAFVRRNEVEILDTWHTGGLRGTGSHDVVVTAKFVARRHTLSPADGSSLPGAFGRVPIVCNMAAGYAAQLLGLGRAAVDALKDLSKNKPVVDPGPGLGERPAALAAIAEHQARLAAAREHLHSRVAQLWAAAEAGKPAIDQIAAVFGAAHHAMAQGRAAVSAMYALAGVSSLYTSSPLERAHRDMHAMAAHVIAQPMWLEDTGRVEVGLKPVNPLYLV
jgi:alkylation response protein AidB-like acyl-CoA dehydrogenase